MNPHITQRLEHRLKKLAERTGYSETEVMDTLLNQFDLIANESDLAWSGQTLEEVVEQARQDRKNAMLAIHILSQSTRDLVTMAQERTNIMASAALMVTKRLGISKPLPEIPSDRELQEGAGYIDSVGRLITGDAQQPGEDEPEPTEGGKTIEAAIPEPVAPQQRPPPEVTPNPHVAAPEDKNLSLTEILPEPPSPESPQAPRR
jgi:hypothetical protein